MTMGVLIDELKLFLDEHPDTKLAEIIQRLQTAIDGFDVATIDQILSSLMETAKSG